MNLSFFWDTEGGYIAKTEYIEYTDSMDQHLLHSVWGCQCFDSYPWHNEIVVEGLEIKKEHLILVE